MGIKEPFIETCRGLEKEGATFKFGSETETIERESMWDRKHHRGLQTGNGAA